MLSHDLGRKLFGNPADKGNVLSPEEVRNILDEWVKNDRLRLHMEQVGNLMHRWATEVEKLDEAESWKWQMAGLLHDADWDQWPELHCKKIIEELEGRRVDPEILHAIASHGPGYFGVEPETKMDHMLYAFDELSGFVHAYSLMRPEGYRGMEIKGVKKRLKEKSFASNVSREDIADACRRSGLELDQLLQFIISRQGEFQTK